MFFVEKPAWPKVGKFHVQIFIDENVLGFYVEMKVALVMDVAKGIDKLARVQLYLLLCQIFL